MNPSTTFPDPDQLATVEQLLVHFEQLEAQFQQVREGLTHSHRLATLGTIASIIAHEYNNILTPMISYCQLAMANPDDVDDMRKAVEKSLKGAERAAHISKSLLGFAREADEQQHAARIRSTIDEAVGCLAREPARDGITLHIEADDTLQAVISPTDLQQVLVNLILNARRALRAVRGGNLTITAAAEGSLIHITVRDTGPGIPADIMDQLFEPFVTRRTTPGETKGTGLGLCISRDLIRAAGGTIRAESKPDEGAAFFITLPKADDLFETT